MKLLQRLLCMSILSLFLSSCYYTSQGYHLLKYTYSAKDIDRLLTHGNIDAGSKKFFDHVKEIQSYAQSLGLRVGKKYTRYKELDQDYLVVVVQAAGPLSVESYKWNYPFMGALPYKGFYKLEAAKKEGKKLKEKGYDVMLRPVSAFSTLNILPDPLYSFMKEYELADLVELLVHEQVHATIWLHRQTAFNEQMASFIAREAKMLYMKQNFGEDSEEYQNIFKQERDNQNYIKFVLETKQQLADLYASVTYTDEEKLIRKEEILKSRQEEFLAQYDTLFKTDGYREVDLSKYNNAYFALFSTYYDDVENDFDRAYERCGKDLKYFISQLNLVLTKREYKKKPFEFLSRIPLKDT